MGIFSIIVVLIVVFSVIRAAKMQRAAKSTEEKPSSAHTPYRPKHTVSRNTADATRPQNYAYQRLSPAKFKNRATKEQQSMWGDEANYFNE